jgi:hypothetical protein
MAAREAMMKENVIKEKAMAIHATMEKMANAKRLHKKNKHHLKHALKKQHS